MPWYQLPKSGVTYFEVDNTPPDGAIEVEAPPGTTPIPSLTERVEDLEAFEASVPGTFAPLAGKADGARALVEALAAGDRSVAVEVMGDSTGDSSTEAPYELTSWLADQFPAYSHLSILWNHTNQSFDRYLLPQVGTAGVPYVTLDGTGDYISTPDSALNSVTGDLTVVAVVRANDYTPGAVMTLGAKWGDAGQRSWKFELATNSVPIFQWTTDGTTAINKNAGVVLPGLVDGVTDLAVAVTLDVDNGSSQNVVKFWTAPFVNGVIGTWTQHGNTATTAGVTSIFDSTAVVEWGSQATGSQLPFAGRFYYGEVRSSATLDSGAIVAAMHPATWVGGSTFSGFSGETWTLNADAAISGAPTLVLVNASTPSQATSYSTDSTRFAKQTPVAPVLSIINYGLNHGGSTTISTDYLALVDALKTKYPLADILALTQGPKYAPTYTADIIRAQAVRMAEVRQIAAVRGLMLADTYKAVTGHADPDSLSDDDIHPNAAGVAVWLTEMKRLFTPWLAAA